MVNGSMAAPYRSSRRSSKSSSKSNPKLSPLYLGLTLALVGLASTGKCLRLPVAAAAVSGEGVVPNLAAVTMDGIGAGGADVGSPSKFFPPKQRQQLRQQLRQQKEQKEQWRGRAGEEPGRMERLLVTTSTTDVSPAPASVVVPTLPPTPSSDADDDDGSTSDSPAATSATDSTVESPTPGPTTTETTSPDSTPTTIVETLAPTTAAAATSAPMGAITLSPSGSVTETRTPTPVPPVDSPPTNPPSTAGDDDDAKSVSSDPMTPSPLAAAEDDDGVIPAPSGDGRQPTEIPTPAPTSPTEETVSETPAPSVEGAVAQLTGSVTAPSSVLGSTESSLTLETALESMFDLDDQDILSVVITRRGTTRRQLLRSAIRRVPLWRGAVENGVQQRTGKRDSTEQDRADGNHGRAMGIEEPVGSESVGGPAGEGALQHHVVAASGHGNMMGAHAFRHQEHLRGPGRAERRLRGEETGPSQAGEQEGQHRRSLQEDDDSTSTAEFSIIFINDPGEDFAVGRGTKAAALIVDGQEPLAEALGTNSTLVIIDDIVFSSTTASDVNTEEAASTFFGGDTTSPSGAAVAIAVVIIVAALCGTGCLGVACGKLWLKRERTKTLLDKEGNGLKSEPAYEYKPRTGGAPLIVPEGSAASNSVTGSGAPANAFQRLAPAVSLAPTGSVGGDQRSQDAQGSGPFQYGSHNGSRGAAGVDEDLVEHDYGDSGQAEGFGVDRDPSFSEFGGNQSTYSDSIVPGGDANDGVLSERSSARFYEDDGTSEWGVGTDYTGAAMGGSIMGAEFPLRKGISSRFSAGPRSQASFAAPSVAASGRSIQSSVAHGAPSITSSRSHFPPRGGISPPYSLGGGASPVARATPGKGIAAIAAAAAEDRASEGPAETNSGGEKKPSESASVTTVRLRAGSSTATTAASPESSVMALQDGAEKARSVASAVPSSLKGDDSAQGPASSAGAEAEMEDKQGGGNAAGGGEGSDGGGDGDGSGDDVLGPVAPAAAATRHGFRSSGSGPGALGRPSLDSAAGSMVGSNRNPNASPPESIVGAGGSWRGLVGGMEKSDMPPPPAPGHRSSGDGANSGVGVNAGSKSNSTADPMRMISAAGDPADLIVDDDAASQWDAGSRRSGTSGRGVGHTSGVNDDDAASQFAGSSVGGRGASGAPGLGGSHNQSWRKASSDRTAEDDGGDRGIMMRRARRGDTSGLRSPTGRNSQSMGGMTMDSSQQDSDRESFASKAGSYALTDIGVPASEQAGHGMGVAAPGSVVESAGGGGLSPTSTLLRSVQGMSELGTERDSYGSDGYTNGYGSDSPGAHSGWERAWMRQRNDARYYEGGPRQG